MAVLQERLQTLLIVYLHFMHPHVFHGTNWVVEKQMFQAKQNVVQDQELAVMLLRNLQMLSHLLGSWNVQTVALHTSCVQFWWLQVQCFAIKHCRFWGDHKSVLLWHTCMDWFVYWHTFSYTSQHVG